MAKGFRHKTWQKANRHVVPSKDRLQEENKIRRISGPELWNKRAESDRLFLTCSLIEI